MGITENGLRKLAANKSSMPVMTASGNTKLDSSPGQGSARNPATPPTSASGNTKLDSSPGQGSKRNAATPVLSASGNTSLDSSPYEGEKGRAQQGDMAQPRSFRLPVTPRSIARPTKAKRAGPNKETWR